jgi:transglutaminase superfamily protein
VKLIIALILAALLSPVATAASKKPSPKVAHLQREIANLHAQLRIVTSQENPTHKLLANLRKHMRSFRTQVADGRSPLANAEHQVREEVGWSKGYAGPSYPLGALTALAAMNYVATHVSATVYAYSFPAGLPFRKRGKTLTNETNTILTAQAGTCTYHVIAFTAIMHHFGYRVRRVDFSYQDPYTGKPGGHSAAEVYYNGDWHFFDPTYDVYYTDATSGSVLSIADERANGGTVHKYSGLFLNLFEDPLYGGNDTAFETDPATSVAYVTNYGRL